MARAEIYLEDKDGGLDFAVRYIGGADPKSGAHQVANLLRKHAESILKERHEPVFHTERAALQAVDDEPAQTPAPAVESSPVIH